MKPYLRKTNKLKRLAWDQKYVLQTLEQREKIFFTDESKLELFGGRRRIYVRRMMGERFSHSIFK